jgi:TB2/DP1, HVA22 family
MNRRNNVNINELINRFEPPSDEELNDNVKYVKVSRYGDDQNSLMKYSERHFDRNAKKRNSATMTNAFELTKQTIAMILQRISGFLEMVSKFPFPRMSVMSFGLTSLLAVFLCPRGFTERALYPGFRIIFSIIYPAYRSFKAVRNKDLKEYLKWIVYWVVYAFYTCIELVTDALLSWFPFYFEIKVIIFIWLLGPSSRGAMRVYKTCIHPTLVSREQVRAKSICIHN